jgi:hypothetical protein
MAHHAHDPAPPVAERFDLKHAGSAPTLLLGAAAIGIIGSLIGLAIPGSRAQFAHSWLFAFFFFFTLCAGGLFWTIVHHATDAEWSVVVRRQMENLAVLIPAFLVLLAPLVFLCQPLLWSWWNINPDEDAILEAKKSYLSHGWFYFRYVAYFVILGFVAWKLRNHSVEQDRDGAVRRSFAMRKWAVGGLALFGVCLTFAAVDYLMAIDYKWFSTMWGVYIFAGAAGSSMSLLVIIVTALRDRGYLKPVTMEHYHIMGKWMLAFTIFWAYIGFDQYMLIWYANIPEESIYFRIRNTESWNILSTILVIGRFFIPFPILLTQWIKKHPDRLKWLAAWIIFMQLLDMYIVVLPALHKTGVSVSIFDFLALLGIGGVVGWLWFKVLASANLFPTRDPRLALSIKLTN